eukprot:9002921-Heterocapsa_arctica.AAC.1
MDMGRVRRDLRFRGGADRLSRLPDACGCFERQTRERGANSDRGTRSTRFLCTNGEKEREQNTKRSRGLSNRDSKSNNYDYEHTRSTVGSKTLKAEGPYTKREDGGGLDGRVTTCRLEKTEGRGQL